jgi:hypothetical protein
MDSLILNMLEVRNLTLNVCFYRFEDLLIYFPLDLCDQLLKYLALSHIHEYNPAVKIILLLCLSHGLLLFF